MIACSIVAVVWQLGLVAAFGFELDPFSILVPFLVFAIGVSHGAQKMNGIMQDIGRGTHRLVAARYTFRRLFLAGLTALLADAVGFGVLMVIDIPVIRELALTASLGVATLIFTNLLLLPVLLSYTGVSPRAAERSLKEEREETRGKGLGRLWALLDKFTTRPLGAGRGRRLGRAGRRRLCRQHPAADRRPRSGRARAARRLALQPGQRLHHQELHAVVRPVRGDREDRQRKAASSTRPWSTPTGWPGRCARSRACRRRCRWPTRCARSPPAPFEGNPKWLTISRNQDVLNYAAQQAVEQQPRPLQHRLLGDAGHRLPVRPQGRHAGPRGPGGRRVRRAAQRQGPRLPAGRRQRRHRGGHQHRRQAGLARDAAVRLPRGDRAVLHHLPQLARGGRRRRAADRSPRSCARR